MRTAKVFLLTLTLAGCATARDRDVVRGIHKDIWWERYWTCTTDSECEEARKALFPNEVGS